MQFGTIGQVLLYVFIAIIVVSIIAGLIIFWYYRRIYNQNVFIYSLVGNKPSLKDTDKARLLRVGIAGDQFFVLRKYKKTLVPPTIQMGKDSWWYWIREDGEWINFSLGNIDEQMKVARAYFVDQDMRMQRLGIEKNLRDRFQKQGLWAKYGTVIVGAIFVIMVTIALVVLFTKLVDVSKALEKTAQAIQSMATSVDRYYGELKDTGEGIRPVQIIASLVLGGLNG